MKRITTLFFSISLLFLIGACDQSQEARFADEIEGIKERTSSIDHSSPLYLFVGSSSIRLWNNLEKDMEPYNTFNAGFGGSAIVDVNTYFDDLIISTKPDTIMFYCGENDIADLGLKSEDVLNNFKKFYAQKEKQLPDVPVYFLSIKPSPSRWAMWAEMVKANDLIKSFTNEKEGLYYIDVSTPMLDAQGNVFTDIFIEDDLHMNEDGYAIWTEVIKERLNGID